MFPYFIGNKNEDLLRRFFGLRFKSLTFKWWKCLGLLIILFSPSAQTASHFLIGLKQFSRTSLKRKSNLIWGFPQTWSWEGESFFQSFALEFLLFFKLLNQPVSKKRAELISSKNVRNCSPKLSVSCSILSGCSTVCAVGWQCPIWQMTRGFSLVWFSCWASPYRRVRWYDHKTSGFV